MSSGEGLDDAAVFPYLKGTNHILSTIVEEESLLVVNMSAFIVHPNCAA